MAEYWCGSQKGWVSDKGKSVADIINAQPVMLKNKWQKAQMTKKQVQDEFETVLSFDVYSNLY